MSLTFFAVGLVGWLFHSISAAKAHKTTYNYYTCIQCIHTSEAVRETLCRVKGKRIEQTMAAQNFNVYFGVFCLALFGRQKRNEKRRRRGRRETPTEVIVCKHFWGDSFLPKSYINSGRKSKNSTCSFGCNAECVFTSMQLCCFALVFVIVVVAKYTTHI